MREKGEGWQEEAGGNGLESWQADRQASRGPAIQFREKKQLITQPTRNLKTRPEA